MFLVELCIWTEIAFSYRLRLSPLKLWSNILIFFPGSSLPVSYFLILIFRFCNLLPFHWYRWIDLSGQLVYVFITCMWVISRKQSMVVLACNTCTQGAKEGGSWVWRQLGYMVRPCLQVVVMKANSKCWAQWCAGVPVTQGAEEGDSVSVFTFLVFVMLEGSPQAS